MLLLVMLGRGKRNDPGYTPLTRFVILDTPSGGVGFKVELELEFGIGIDSRGMGNGIDSESS